MFLISLTKNYGLTAFLTYCVLVVVSASPLLGRAFSFEPVSVPALIRSEKHEQIFNEHPFHNLTSLRNSPIFFGYRINHLVIKCIFQIQAGFTAMTVSLENMVDQLIKSHSCIFFDYHFKASANRLRDHLGRTHVFTLEWLG